MTTARIAAAFASRLKTWADGRSKPLRIAFQNIPFTPPDGTYLRAFCLPARTDSITLDRLHRGYRGVYQVSVVLAAGAGYGEGLAIAAELDALFPCSAQMVRDGLTIYVITPMSAASGLVEDDGRFVVPVSCTYEANA